MPITIGSNIASLQAQRRLNESSARLERAYERLGSGARINHASDDAAGLAISDSLKSDSRIFGQAIRNGNDGLSMLAIAESSLQELSNVLVRISELAEQSANGVYSSNQRQAMDRESDALQAEYSRIVESTQFNGRYLLRQAIQLDFQVGKDSSASSRIQANIALVSSVTGDGTFQNESTLSVGGSNNSILSADLNADGHMDVVVDAFGVLLGNGNGTFKAKVNYSSAGGLSYYTETKAGDVNGDGKLDLLTHGTYNDTVQVLIGNGDGSFKAVVSYSAPSVGVTNDIEIGDFDGDGKNDVITTDYLSRLIFLKGNGDGTFQAAISQTGATTQIDSGDFNSDGILDIVGPGSLFIGNGNGSFKAAVGFSNSGGGRGTVTKDFNGDGFLDVASVSPGATFGVTLGNGNGTFKAGISYTAGGVSFNDYQLSSADLNGDGRADIVISEETSQSIGVYLNRGNGTFGTRASYAAVGGGDVSTMADFNEDGAVDIVHGKQTGLLSFYFGNLQQLATLDDIDLSTAQSARNALSTVQELTAQISTQIGAIGSIQSRIQVALSVASVSREQSEAAASRIRDADIASESAVLIRNQILQQAASAVLGQANLQPNLAIKLLRG